MYYLFMRLFALTVAALRAPLTTNIVLNLGRASAIAGFILAINALITPLTGDALIYPLIFTPLSVFVVLTVNEYIKASYMNKNQAQFEEDTEVLEVAVKKLSQVVLEEKIKMAVPNSQAAILAIVNNPELAARSMPPNEMILAAIAHSLVDSQQKDKLLKYATNIVDVIGTSVVCASTIFVEFVLPAVLKNEFFDSGIEKPAFVLAMAYAIFGNMYLLAISEQRWQEFHDQKDWVKEGVERLNQLQVNADNDGIALNNPVIKSALLFWANKVHPQQQPAQEVGAEPEVSRNSGLAAV